MGRNCAVFKCNTTAKNIKNDCEKINISLHKVPKNQELQKKWLTACGINIEKNIFVCSNHFQESDYEVNKGIFSSLLNKIPRPVLKKDAIPSIFFNDNIKMNSSTELIHNRFVVMESLDHCTMESRREEINCEDNHVLSKKIKLENVQDFNCEKTNEINFINLSPFQSENSINKYDDDIKEEEIEVDEKANIPIIKCRNDRIFSTSSINQEDNSIDKSSEIMDNINVKKTVDLIDNCNNIKEKRLDHIPSNSFIEIKCEIINNTESTNKSKNGIATLESSIESTITKSFNATDKKAKSSETKNNIFLQIINNQKENAKELLTLKRLLGTINEKLDNMSDDIQALRSNNNKQLPLTHTQSELDKNTWEIISQILPLKFQKDFDQLINFIKDTECRKVLMMELKELGGLNIPEYIRLIMEYLISNELARQTNITGSDGKWKFGDAILMDLIFNTVKSKHSIVTKREIEIQIARWLETEIAIEER